MGLKSLVSSIASKLVPKITALSLAAITSLAVGTATNVAATMTGESGAGTHGSSQDAIGFGYSSHNDSL